MEGLRTLRRFSPTDTSSVRFRKERHPLEVVCRSRDSSPVWCRWWCKVLRMNLKVTSSTGVFLIRLIRSFGIGLNRSNQVDTVSLQLVREGRTDSTLLVRVRERERISEHV